MFAGRTLSLHFQAKLKSSSDEDSKMKLKINKACDLSSISVLPPQSRFASGFIDDLRRKSSTVAGGIGLESSSIYGRSQTVASQLRSQQPQQSQQSFSQGISSQHGLFSQFSQNSHDETLTVEKLGSQEIENSVKRTSGLPPISYTREENQMVLSRTSSNVMRKWSGPEHKRQTSEELEHRMGIVETSLNRLGMIMDSVQSDIMQVNKGTKEVALEMDGVRQKLIAHDSSLQLLNKGQEDIKNRLDIALKTLSDQIKQNMNQDNLREIFLMLSSLPEKINRQMVKLQNDLCMDFNKKVQDLTCSLQISKQNQATSSIHIPKAANCCMLTQEVQIPNNAKRQAQKESLAPKVEVGGWTSVKQERTTSKVGNLCMRNNQIKVSTNHLETRSTIVIESDEEIDCGFSCLLKEKGSEVDNHLIVESNMEIARILRKARRRKRKYSNTVIIN